MTFEYKKDELAKLVDGIKTYATWHYEEDGWDIVVECLADDEIASIIHGAVSRKGAVRKMKEYLSPLADIRGDMMSEAW